MENLNNESLNRSSDKGAVITSVIAIILVLLALVTRFFIITNFITDGSSMEPTYSDSQRVWVFKTKNISRGDVIVIKDAEENKYLIKRVIAFEGDCLRIKQNPDGRWRIQIKYKGTSDWIDENYEGVDLPSFSVDDLALWADNIVQEYYANGEYVVKEGVFLMGDNRLVSLDSRVRGEFPLALIQGKVIN